MAYRQSDYQRRNDPVRYDLMERIGVLSVKENGWTREVNIVSWNNGAAKVDIREWAPDHNRMTKGITLFEEEAERLTKLLAGRYGLRMAEGGPAHRTAAGAESGRDFLADDCPPGTSQGIHSYDAPAAPSEETAELSKEGSVISAASDAVISADIDAEGSAVQCSDYGDEQSDEADTFAAEDAACLN